MMKEFKGFSLKKRCAIALIVKSAKIANLIKNNITKDEGVKQVVSEKAVMAKVCEFEGDSGLKMETLMSACEIDDKYYIYN